MKNPVAKNLFEFNKPKVERNRKKHPSKKQKVKEQELHHPLHEPYKRPDRGELVNTLIGDWDAL